MLLGAVRRLAGAAGGSAGVGRATAAAAVARQRMLGTLATAAARRPVAGGAVPWEGEHRHWRMRPQPLGMGMMGGSRAGFATTATTWAGDEGSTTHEFQAETRKILDIVTHSIYTDKEVFLRELVSNASDSLAKLKHLQLATGGGTVTAAEAMADATTPMAVFIDTDPEAGTLSVTDTGVGMTADEMVSNLGTIARSGSSAFVEQMQQASSAGMSKEEIAQNIIGQFGVGFYSAFMVADHVSVYSVPAPSAIAAAAAEGDGESADATSHVWSSDGGGTYELREFSPEDLPPVMRPEVPKPPGAGTDSDSDSDSDDGDADGAAEDSRVATPSPLPRGVRIVMNLKEDCKHFANQDTIRDVIRKYSNFVSFPIYVNGERANTVRALWLEDKNSIEESEYADFYKFISHSPFDEPRYTLHFRTDAPLDLNALLFVPHFHTEKFGAQRLPPGVSIYSRKVLIESKPKDLLPEWLRFVQGVVDSEDLPLSISREKPQDSALIRKIGDVLTRKLIRHIEERAKNDADEYKTFYLEFSQFLKEGICTDARYKEQIAKLLRYESSKLKENEYTSLDEYISRCPPEQKEIYYLIAPTRELAESSPYFETFKKHDKEVLFMYNAIDDFVMQALRQHEGRALIGAESVDVSLDDAKADKDKDKDGKDASAADDADGDGDGSSASGVQRLTDEQGTEFCEWLDQLMPNVKEATITDRLVDTPAVILDHESGAARRMKQFLEQHNTGKEPVTPPQHVAVNPAHPVIVRLYHMRESQPELANTVAAQVVDNAMIAAGMLDDSRSMLGRLNSLLNTLTEMNDAKSSAESEDEGSSEPSSSSSS